MRSAAMRSCMKRSETGDVRAPRESGTGLTGAILALACFLAVGVSAAETTSVADELAGVPPALAETLQTARAETVQKVLEAKTPLERSSAWGRLAMLYHAQRLRELARDTYSEALRAADLTEWRYLRGIARSELGDIEGSIRDFLQVTELDPKDPAAWYRLGLARWLSGDVAAGREALEQALTLTPEAAVVMAALSDVVAAEGDTDRAIELLERAWGIEPEAGQLAFKLAALHRQRADLEAVDTWLGRDPGNRLAPKIDDRRLLEVAYLSQSSRVFEVAADWALARGDTEQAIRSLRNAVAFAPDHVGLGVRLITELANAGRGADAIAAARKLTERIPDAARAWYVLAFMQRTSEPGPARAALARCRELADPPEARELAAAFAMQDKDYGAAAELYAGLLANSAVARHAYWLGIAKLGGGDCQGVAALERALALQKGWGQAHIALARAEALCGKGAVALQRADAVLRARDDVDTRITMAFARLGAGDLSRAGAAARAELPHADAAMLLQSIDSDEFAGLRPFAEESAWWLPPLVAGSAAEQ